MTGPNFRQYQGRLLAALLRKFGPHRLESILDAVQEALVLAVETWPHTGEPSNPLAWLHTVAKRRLLDELRRDQRVSNLEVVEAFAADPAEKEELALYFSVCAPALNATEQLCLMLRTLGGLTALEIAHALHESEEAVQKRITRSKQRLTMEDLDATLSPDKVHTVLVALYLLFNEGYEATRGESYLRVDLTQEALRLGQRLAELLPQPNHELFALLALMHLHSARLPARVKDGQPVLWKDQEPSQFDHHHLAAGFAALELAQGGDTLTRFHLEAGLAASMAAADPPEIQLQWLADIRELFPSPIAEISYAIALGELEGPETGLQILQFLPDDSPARHTSHYHCARAHFLLQLHDPAGAADAYRKAISATMSQPTRRSIEQRLSHIEPML